MKLGVYTVPYLYVAYMWLVYKTSRVEEIGYRPDLVRAERGGGVFALWHDEVLFVAWAFGKYRGCTLASPGDSGEMITRILELCGYQVLRGGSSTSRSRRAISPMRAMVRHLRDEPGVIYGITTDGPSGPVYRMKEGAVGLAVSGQREIFVAKTWCRRYFRLPTWDRTLVPLPFNRLVHVYAGPIVPPSDARAPETFAALCRETERRLCLVTAYARRRAEGRAPPRAWIDLFPAHCREEMARDATPELILAERGPGGPTGA